MPKLLLNYTQAHYLLERVHLEKACLRANVCPVCGHHPTKTDVCDITGQRYQLTCPTCNHKTKGY